MLMTTLGTSLRGMTRVNLDHGDSSLSSFIGQERVELGKRPTVKTALALHILVLLSASNLACTTDMGQILNHQGRTRESVGNDAFREDMVAIPVKTCLLASQFLEVTLGRLASFGLQ